MLAIPGEWAGIAAFWLAAALALLLYLIWSFPRVAWSRRVFGLVGLALTAIAFISSTVDLDDVFLAASRATFIAAFFLAQATLRHAASQSAAIERCGRFLASRPPGKRYLALTTGGHLFGLILSYGAISLLGSLGESAARSEPDQRIRELRTRRMLLAVQRGFVSTLAWSPLAFSFAVSNSIIEGSSWGSALPICVVSTVILASLGWLMDHLVKPPVRPAGPRPSGTGRWQDTLPLLLLLVLLMTSVFGLQYLTGIRAVGVVLVAVPLLSIGWVALQLHLGARRVGPGMIASGREFIAVTVPNYRAEIMLLSMAAYIGSLGSTLLLPLLSDSVAIAMDIPPWLVLVGLVWLVPLTGQLGMNPVLSVTLLAPLLPAPSAMGISPDMIIVAITAGWALGGASSPFTATTVIVGAIGKVSPWRVGLNWNGGYTIVAGTVLSAWVIVANLFVT